MDTQLLEEFRLDWRLSGRAHRTVDMYVNDIVKFLDSSSQVSITGAKSWHMSTVSPTVRLTSGWYTEAEVESHKKEGFKCEVLRMSESLVE